MTENGMHKGTLYGVVIYSKWIPSSPPVCYKILPSHYPTYKPSKEVQLPDLQTFEIDFYELLDSLLMDGVYRDYYGLNCVVLQYNANTISLDFEFVTAQMQVVVVPVVVPIHTVGQYVMSTGSKGPSSIEFIHDYVDAKLDGIVDILIHHKLLVTKPTVKKDFTEKWKDKIKATSGQKVMPLQMQQQLDYYMKAVDAAGTPNLAITSQSVYEAIEEKVAGLKDVDLKPNTQSSSCACVDCKGDLL